MAVSPSRISMYELGHAALVSRRSRTSKVTVGTRREGTRIVQTQVAVRENVVRDRVYIGAAIRVKERLTSSRGIALGESAGESGQIASAA